MADGVLAGIRVIDYTWIGVGPFATKFLADFGADVIKIESTTRVDQIRTMRPAAGGQQGVNRSGYFANRNTSKRSITLNMRHPQAVEIVRELLKHSDVLINNYSPGVMAKMGLSYEVVARLNPRIIYVDMPMQGNDGPFSQSRGYGAMMNALSGLYALTGLPGRRPVGTGTQYPDHVPNCLHVTTAILAALYDRLSTDRGTYIEEAQLESTLNILGPSLMQYLNTDQGPAVMGNRHPEYVPQGAYQCSDERWCAITVRTEQQWRSLSGLLDRQDWQTADSLATSNGRRQMEAEIDLALAAWMAARTAAEAMRLLQSQGIPAGVVQDAQDVLRDSQLVANGHWVYLDHPEMGRCVYDGPVPHLSSTPARLSRPAPLQGQHTREVCRELLGMSDERFEELRAQGVFD